MVGTGVHVLGLSCISIGFGLIPICMPLIHASGRCFLIEAVRGTDIRVMEHVLGSEGTRRVDVSFPWKVGCMDEVCQEPHNSLHNRGLQDSGEMRGVANQVHTP